MNAVPVHYQRGGASSLAIVTGEVKAGFGTIPVHLPHVKAGKLRAYIVTGSKRFQGTPDLPTAAEAGIPGFELEFWIGPLAPSRTSSEIVARLNRDVGAILQTPAMHATLLAQGVTAAPGTAQEFAAIEAPL